MVVRTMRLRLSSSVLGCCVHRRPMWLQGVVVALLAWHCVFCFSFGSSWRSLPFSSSSWNTVYICVCVCVFMFCFIYLFIYIYIYFFSTEPFGLCVTAAWHGGLKAWLRRPVGGSSALGL